MRMFCKFDFKILWVEPFNLVEQYVVLQYDFKYGLHHGFQMAYAMEFNMVYRMIL